MELLLNVVLLWQPHHIEDSSVAWKCWHADFYAIVQLNFNKNKTLKEFLMFSQMLKANNGSCELELRSWSVCCKENFEEFKRMNLKSHMWLSKANQNDVFDKEKNIEKRGASHFTSFIAEVADSDLHNEINCCTMKVSQNDEAEIIGWIVHDEKRNDGIESKWDANFRKIDTSCMLFHFHGSYHKTWSCCCLKNTKPAKCQFSL